MSWIEPWSACHRIRVSLVLPSPVPEPYLRVMALFERHPEVDQLGEEDLHLLRNRLLQQHVTHCLRHSAWYRDILGADGVEVHALDSLPFTTKQDLCEHPDAFLAVHPDDLADRVTTSGTTGPPLRFGYTRGDLERLAYNEERCFRGAGIGRGDRVLLTCTLDRGFVAGLAYYLGSMAAGATAIRAGLGTLESHREVFVRERPTVVVGVPGFLLKLGQELAASGILLGKAPVSKLICIGEPLRDENLQPLRIASELENLWSAKTFSTYASTETITSFCECSAGRGGQLLPELAFVEIVDEEGQGVPPGVQGEVVVTPLGVEAFPLIRYRTGDISFLETTPISSDRRSPRLGPILGRKNQRLKIQGTTLFPQAVLEALRQLEVPLEGQVELQSAHSGDGLLIRIPQSDQMMPMDLLKQELQARLRIKPEVRVCSPEEFDQRLYPPGARKPMRIVDLR